MSKHAQPAMLSPKADFWRWKWLDEMSEAEWESLCDGCGKCCLAKLEDCHSGKISYTNVACQLLNIETGKCRRYDRRFYLVHGCQRLTPDSLHRFPWLPSTCAYRLLYEGKDLPWWHPLVSGDPQLVHTAGFSVAGKAIPEKRAGPLHHHIVSWPE